jgi:hypothetical protein
MFFLEVEESIGGGLIRRRTALTESRFRITTPAGSRPPSSAIIEDADIAEKTA